MHVHVACQFLVKICNVNTANSRLHVYTAVACNIHNDACCHHAAQPQVSLSGRCGHRCAHLAGRVLQHHHFRFDALRACDLINVIEAEPMLSRVCLKVDAQALCRREMRAGRGRGCLKRAAAALLTVLRERAAARHLDVDRCAVQGGARASFGTAGRGGT
jgi:hypothetical protein